jgi:hypothetical protein
MRSLSKGITQRKIVLADVITRLMGAAHFDDAFLVTDTGLVLRILMMQIALSARANRLDTGGGVAPSSTTSLVMGIRNSYGTGTVGHGHQDCVDYPDCCCCLPCLPADCACRPARLLADFDLPWIGDWLDFNLG